MIPSREDMRYWQGAMDAIGLATIEGFLDRDKVESLRKKMGEMEHTHYSSMLGPFCAICRIDLTKKSDYKTYADGQGALG